MASAIRKYPELLLESVKKRRQTPLRPNYWDSVWGQMLLHEDISNGSSYIAKKFRRRFRVPYALFKEIILPQCEAMKVFPVQRKSPIPLEFKILICLRIIGRDAVADECNELTHIGESTCHTIFKEFVKNYSRIFYDAYVNMPTGSDLVETMETYRRLGFPGCIGSIDCTHVKWSACGKDKKWKATGKEGYPYFDTPEGSFAAGIHRGLLLEFISFLHLS